MQKEQITILKELVGKIAGKNTELIVDIIATKKPVNEFKIAEKLELTINQTRNILYKLSAQGIVYSIRKKDARKGWYIYSWAIDTPKALAKFIEYKKKEVKNYEYLLNSRRTKSFYICPSECIETSEENAMVYEFKCPECGQLLQPESFSQEIKDLQINLDDANKEIAIIQGELDGVLKIKEKKEIRKMNKEKAEKLAARRKKAALKKKALGKGNKVVKKKVKKAKKKVENKIIKKAKKKVKPKKKVKKKKRK